MKNQEKKADVLKNGLRESVKAADNWTCQVCGSQHRGNLTVHHILPQEFYSKLSHEHRNLITLCRSCHDLEHETKGRYTVHASSFLGYTRRRDA